MTKEEYLEQYPEEATTSDAMRAKTTWSLRKAPHWERIWSKEYLIDYVIYKHERGEDLSPWTVYRFEPAVHAIDMIGPQRADEVRSDRIEGILSNTPHHRDGYYVVPPILEDAP